jgi:hypothetical protein
VTVIAAFPPLQSMGVAMAALPARADGSVTVTDVVPLQPLASVTVKLYVPAVRVNVPTPVYGAVPPDAATVTVALPPLQATGVVTFALICIEGIEEIVTSVMSLQPLSSVTVKLCFPGPRLNLPTPLYGGLPPEAVTVTSALLFVQYTTVAVAAAASCGGSLTESVVEPLQPAASVTVNVYVPADLLNVPVPEYGGVPPVAAT